MHDLLYRLRALFRRGAQESELEDELRLHLELQSEKLRASGIPAAQAERRARIALGGSTQIREECRDSWGIRWLLDFLQDARFGLRALRRGPVFALAAILSLALGIGANTAIFSVIDAVLLRPLPHPEPHRLTMIWETFAKRRQFHNVVSPANYLDWQSQTTAFEQIAAIDTALNNLTGLGEPEEVRGQYVTANFFPLFSVAPALGRTFTAAEAAAGAPVIVLSHRFWERRLALDPNVLGRTVEMDRKPLTVIGVMPPGYERLDIDGEFWRPFHVDPNRDHRARDGRFLNIVARLKPGVSISAAQAQIAAVAARSERDYPAFSKGWGARVVSMRDEISGDYRTALYILLGAVGLVLLIACGNVANLLLARGVARGREFAIRASIGAGPWRIARQLLAESLLLAAAGGIAGGLLALAFQAALQHTAPKSLARLADVPFDARVMAFCLLLSLASAILFGLAPALLGSRSGAGGRLKQARSRRAPNLLVTAEFALCLVLLVSAGLLIRSFVNLLSVHTGFQSDHLLTARVLLPGSYKAPQSVAFFAEATRRIQALPGVRSASAVTFMPFGGIRPGTIFQIENRPKPSAGDAPVTEVRAIQPRYFATMGIPLLRGRDFTDRDNSPDRPVFIINQSLASKFWPNEDPIGQRITVDMGAKPAPGEIVGIAADVRDQKLDGATAPTVFYAHPGLPIGYMSFVVRTAGDPASVARAIPQVVHSLDPNQPVVDIRTMDQLLLRSISQQRFQMLLLALFAAIALALATVGIYGVISYSVTQRTNEIGIRVALGASRGDVLRLVLSQGGAIVVRGLLLGLAAALALTRIVSGLLFGVKPTDPLTFAGVAVLLTAVALLALAGPARRASRLDPLRALRHD